MKMSKRTTAVKVLLLAGAVRGIFFGADAYAEHQLNNDGDQEDLTAQIIETVPGAKNIEIDGKKGIGTFEANGKQCLAALKETHGNGFTDSRWVLAQIGDIQGDGWWDAVGVLTTTTSSSRWAAEPATWDTRNGKNLPRV